MSNLEYENDMIERRKRLQAEYEEWQKVANRKMDYQEWLERSLIGSRIYANRLERDLEKQRQGN